MPDCGFPEKCERCTSIRHYPSPLVPTGAHAAFKCSFFPFCSGINLGLRGRLACKPRRLRIILRNADYQTHAFERSLQINSRNADAGTRKRHPVDPLATRRKVDETTEQNMQLHTHTNNRE